MVANMLANTLQDIKTKSEVTGMVKPLIEGYTENQIHTNKL